MANSSVTTELYYDAVLPTNGQQQCCRAQEQAADDQKRKPRCYKLSLGEPAMKLRTFFLLAGLLGFLPSVVQCYANQSCAALTAQPYRFHARMST
jgi:hypothetical protein